jgi:hypothetical protein
MRKLRHVGSGEDDPLDGVANFFDLGVIFALGFMVPLMARLALPAAVEGARAAAPDERVRVEHYRPTHDPIAGAGQRLGVAYQLANGEVVYVPDPAAPSVPDKGDSPPY